MTLKQAIEALVFASQKPISPKEIVAALRAAGSESEIAEAQDFSKTKEDDVVAILQEQEKTYQHVDQAFQLVEKVTGWQFVTNPSYAPWVRQLFPESKPTRLSGPALETLAIIAYRQPITRADIEAVRGVAVDGMVNALLERGLIRIAGRAELPGRPLLYESTQYFLEHFGLKKLDELPNAGELRRIVLPKAEIPAESAPAAPVAEPAPQKPETASAAAAEESAPAPEEPVPAAPAPEPESAPAEPVDEPASEVVPGEPEPPIQDQAT